MPMYDMHCPNCHARFEDIAKLEDKVECPACHASFPCEGNHYMGIAKPFSTIVPTTATSKKYKAGYVHSHGNRPKTEGKIQVGYNGTPKT